jgi:exodeoxyribonuclease VII large subunit
MPEVELPELSVSQFVALHNQLLEYSMPVVSIVGELSSFRVSKNRWVYFDLKDEEASVKFFSTIYQLPGPLEDGLLVRVIGTPRVHPRFGFSINVQSIQPVGEGALKRTADLLARKLEAEGLFDPARKRQLPYPPQTVGVVTSEQSAAYADFIKVLGARWGGLELLVFDVQVQGDAAPAQISSAIANFNQQTELPDVLIVIRGGGSIEDLAAFNSEQVVRAVAASRIPTLVAIGHEVDTSLAELAADVRASTPSNAAELLVPDRARELAALEEVRGSLTQSLNAVVVRGRTQLKHVAQTLNYAVNVPLERLRSSVTAGQQVLMLLNPKAILARGYAIVRNQNGIVIRTAAGAGRAERLAIEFADDTIEAKPEKS